MSNSFIENVNYLAKLDNAFGDNISLNKTNISFRGTIANVKFKLSYYDNSLMKILSVETLFNNAAYTDLNSILSQFKSNVEDITGVTCSFTLSTNNNAYLVSLVNISLSSSNNDIKFVELKFEMEKDGIELYDVYGKITDPLKILPHLALYDEILIASIISINTYKDELIDLHTNISSLNILVDNIEKLSTIYNNLDNINTNINNLGNINIVANDLSNGLGVSSIINVSQNIDSVNNINNSVVPNINEILLADDNAIIATTKANEANASALSASNSAATATSKATIATTKANDASISAAASATSASEASSSATTASTKASIATTQANTATDQATIAISQAAIASAQASNASAYASNALASEQNVANYLAAIEAIYDNFDDRYLGAYDADPLTDNDGNSLKIGAIYFNLTTNDVKFYNGTSWENPELTSTQAASNALSYMNSAQTAATNAQNSATASANSATNSNIYAADSQASANSANTYASNAQVYATNSDNSALASAASASNSEADRILAHKAATSASDSATSSQTSATASASSASSALSAKTQAESYASDANASKLVAANSATSASTNATIAINKANEALVSADQASVSASTAVSAAADAVISESNAEASMEKAEKWAEELENIEVEVGKYSAKHWALKAKLFANGSADNISYNGSISGLVSTNTQAAIDELDANIDLLGTNKVDKITGKGLSTEDYTTAEKTKLSGIAASANNYVLPIASSTVLGGVKAGTNISIDANGVISANDISVAWSEITSKPTTLSGYGITDSYTKTELGTVSEFNTSFDLAK